MMKFIKYTGFPVLCGIVFGMLIAELTKGVSFLKWLAFGCSFGIPQFELNLNIINLSLAFTINLSVSTILCIIAALLIAKRIYKR